MGRKNIDAKSLGRRIGIKEVLDAEYENREIWKDSFKMSCSTARKGEKKKSGVYRCKNTDSRKNIEIKEKLLVGYL